MAFFPLKGISQTTQINDTMETIIPSGSNASGSSGSVTYSIGQVFYTYIGLQADYIVAQGIQQQESDKNLGTPEVEEPKTEIFVFPNPAADFVNVSMKGYELESENRSFKLYDIQGRLIKQNKINQDDTQVSLNNLSPSIYILVVYVDNHILKSFKILKK
ncbi:Por secretion system C-terminal sorting domain-containing protein [Flavobacterium defluvii]|uniref:Por secretion system C-terminal sorting domain-containing protein n=2 Tax=Flavobacterium defluvii TaxID=370979 RepID=A0A1M5PSL2_9FLAO|nr:Por secretion system C-terminal sorting domain-containing protein [Flavobacterium defluvii]